MLTTPIKALLAGLFLLCGTLGPACAADSPGGTPARFIDGLSQRFIDALETPPESEQRRRLLRAIFDQALDYETMARFTLGRHWPKTTATLRGEYVDVFRLYVVELYAIQLGKFLGQTYRIVGERQVTDTGSMVSVEIDQPDSTASLVEFKLVTHGADFKVVDVLVERVSLIITKRAEFGAVIMREGVEGLIDRLRQVTARGASYMSPGQMSLGLVIAAFMRSDIAAVLY